MKKRTIYYQKLLIVINFFKNGNKSLLRHFDFSLLNSSLFLSISSDMILNYHVKIQHVKAEKGTEKDKNYFLLEVLQMNPSTDDCLTLKNASLPINI